MEDLENLNLGCVIYQLTNQGLEAEWVQSANNKIAKGTGKAIRITELKPGRKFEGTYEITYEDQQESRSPMLQLKIMMNSDCYHLTWSLNEKITETGIGVISHDRLVVSYKSYRSQH